MTVRNKVITQFSIYLFLFFNIPLLAQWQPISVETTANLDALDFYDAQNGIVCGLSNKYFKTSDGGQNWEAFTIGEFRFAYTPFDIAYLANNSIVLVGFQSSPRRQQIIRSTDGGQSWVSVFLGANRLFLNKIEFLSLEKGIVIGDGGTIVKTYDGGATWETVIAGTSNDLWDLSFANESLGFIAAGTQYLKTSDGGENWSVHTISGLSDIRNIATVKNTSIAYASDGYQVYRTKDAGATWVATDTLGEFYKEHLLALDSDILMASNDGSIYQSKSQGQYWERYQAAQGIIIRNFNFLTENIGYFVGNQGIVYQTKTGNGIGIPVARIQSDKTEVCPDEPVRIENLSDPNLDFQWYINDQFYNSSDRTIDISLEEFATNRISLVVSNGVFNDTTNVGVYVSPIEQPTSFSYTISATEICPNQSVVVEVQNSPLNQKYKVLLDGNQVQGIKTGNGNTLRWRVSGILNDAKIEIIAEKEQRCENTILTYNVPIKVQNYTTLVVTGSSSKAAYCRTDSIELFIHNSIPDYSYEVVIDSLILLNLASQRTSVSLNYAIGTKIGNGNSLSFKYYLPDFKGFEYLRGNQHSIFVTNALGCRSKIPLKIETKSDAIDAKFDLLSSFVYANEPISINYSAPENATLQWDFGANATPSSSMDQSPEIYFDSINYNQQITLIASSASGCVDTFSQSIYIHEKAPESDGLHCNIEGRLRQTHLLSGVDAYWILDATIDKFGNLLVSGAYRFSSGSISKNRFFLMKFNAEGELLWEKTTSRADTSSYQGSICGAVATDSDGNIYLGGSYTSANIFFQIDDFQFPREMTNGVDDDSKKCFILKLNPDGKILWGIHSYQTDGGNIAADISDIIVTESDQIIVSCVGGFGMFKYTDQRRPIRTGLNVIEIDKEGRWVRETSAGSIDLNNAGRLNFEQSSFRTNRVAIVSPKMELTSNGSIVFVGVMGKQLNFTNRIKVTPKYENANSIYTARLNLDSFAWEDAFKLIDFNFTLNQRFLFNMMPVFTIDKNEDIVVAHNWRYIGNSPEESQAEIGTAVYPENRGSFLAKFEQNGNMRWSNYSRTSQIRSLTTLENNEIITYGQFDDFLSVSGTNRQIWGRTALGKQDIFLASLDEEGQYNWLETLGGRENDDAGIMLGACDRVNHFSTFSQNPTIDSNPYFTEKIFAPTLFSIDNDCDPTDCFATITSTENEPISKVTITVSPNPFYDQVTLQIAAMPSQKQLTLNLYDAYGKKVRQYSSYSGDRLVINRGNLINGVYFYDLRVEVSGVILTNGRILAH